MHEKTFAAVAAGVLILGLGAIAVPQATGACEGVRHALARGNCLARTKQTKQAARARPQRTWWDGLTPQQRHMMVKVDRSENRNRVRFGQPISMSERNLTRMVMHAGAVTPKDQGAVFERMKWWVEVGRYIVVEAARRSDCLPDPALVASAASGPERCN